MLFLSSSLIYYCLELNYDIYVSRVREQREKIDVGTDVRLINGYCGIGPIKNYLLKAQARHFLYHSVARYKARRQKSSIGRSRSSFEGKKERQRQTDRKALSLFLFIVFLYAMTGENGHGMTGHLISRRGVCPVVVAVRDDWWTSRETHWE